VAKLVEEAVEKGTPALTRATIGLLSVAPSEAIDGTDAEETTLASAELS